MKEIAKMIIDEIVRIEGDVSFDMKYIFNKLDVVGRDNNHLANPLNLYGEVHYFRDREVPLTGNETVFGDYLLLEYIGHNEDMYLIQFDSLKDIEKFIIGGRGITNPFTTYLIAIIHGEIRKYKIYYRDAFDDNEYEFIKGQELKKFDIDKEQVKVIVKKNNRIQWLD